MKHHAKVSLFFALALGLFLAAVAAQSAAEDGTTDAAALKAAVTKSLPLLEKSAKISMEARKQCFTCHNVGLPVLALTTARSRGFAVDEDLLRSQVQFTADFLTRGRDNYLAGKGQGGQALTAGSALLALENGGWKADATTAAVTEYLLSWQKDLDYWRPQSIRPPSEESLFAISYVALRGLKTFGTTEQRERIERRGEQVRTWALKTPAQATEDRAFRLWLLKAAGATEADVREAARELSQAQRADGGWAQLAGMESDAYATGTALVALKQAGGIPAADAVYQRGLSWLLKAQLEDGSWHVSTRSKPIQVYYESGYPHEKDQFISITAACWATTALALALPEKSEAEQKTPTPPKASLEGVENFEVEGRKAFVILPPPPARPGDGPIPWVWYAPTLPGLPGGAEKWMFERFTQAGIAVAGIDVGESYGSPSGRALYSALYRELTAHRGFAPKAVMLGRSRGGLMTLAWAVENADKVAGFAGVYPVCNVASYPGVAKAAGAYGMTAEELSAKLTEHNPIDRLASLARAGVPLFAIHGDVDKVVPLEANSGELRKRYETLGGRMQLIIPLGQGHNMWPGFFQCQELVDFVLAHARAHRTADKTLPAGQASQTPAPPATPAAALLKGRVEYYELGSGPAVLMLHGGQCSADDWADIAPALAKNYRLILTDGLVAPLDPWRVWLLLDHLGVKKVALVGHSAGGTLAREIYRLQPDRVWAFVNIDSEGTGPTILARDLPAEKLSAQAAALLEQNKEAVKQFKPHHRGDYPSLVNIEHRLLGYRRATMTPEERAQTRTWAPPLAFAPGPNAPAAPQPIAVTGKFITCPVLVVHTGRGKLGPEDISREWIDQNVQATDVDYAVIKESGHWPWHEQQPWFLSRLEPFLARAAAATK